jgi:hypothetical protein
MESKDGDTGSDKRQWLNRPEHAGRFCWEKVVGEAMEVYESVELDFRWLHEAMLS